MRNILLLIKGLGRGGAEQILVSSAKYGNDQRFKYEVAYLLPWKDAFVSELDQLGVEVGCLEGARGVGWLSRLRRLVRDHRIDLVHAHSPLPAAAVRVALPRSLPLVYTEHNMWQRYHRATYWANLLTYRRNEHVFAVSEHVRSSVRYPRVLEFLGMPPVETLYHGPDLGDGVPSGSSVDVLRDLGIPEGAPVVGTVANLKAHKGHEYLLQAAVLVREALPGARFVVVGQGPLEGELRRSAHDLGLDGAVVFAGFREDAVRVASAFDIFVLPSIHEGLPIALMEAMSLGKPAVVTAVGGLPELLLNDEHGYLVPPADPISLAKPIIRLLRDKDLRDRLGGAARVRASLFQIEAAVRRIEAVYEELLGNA